MDFLVIGAGLAGLAFARQVQAAGATVQLLDKGRGRRRGDLARPE